LSHPLSRHSHAENLQKAYTCCNLAHETETTAEESKFNPGLLALIAIILAFLLALVFIWLWYDLKNNSHRKTKISMQYRQPDKKTIQYRL
jgi:flagellar biogenesis protein FliO